MEECAQQEVIVPDSIQQQLNNLNSDWDLVKALSEHVQPVTKVTHPLSLTKYLDSVRISFRILGK